MIANTSVKTVHKADMPVAISIGGRATWRATCSLILGTHQTAVSSSFSDSQRAASAAWA